MAAEARMWAKHEEGTESSNSALADYDAQVENLKLPKDFIWGAATAAYQVEGGTNEDGKGKSIWDTYSHLEPSRTNGQNGDVACDQYHRFEEDIKLMADLGMETYRLSIAWTRIIPLGGRNDPINEAGIAFYNRFIDALLAHNIQPCVTLYHWDLPQGLYDRYGGFANTAEFRADFEHYARLCFTRFGDRVTNWVTFNEPYIISIFGHLNGSLAPGHNAERGYDTLKAPWRVGHTLIVSHAAAVRIYAEEFRVKQKGTITIVLNGHFYEPFDKDNPADVAAAQTRLEFYIGWFGDTCFLGRNYPECMRKYLGERLPEFTDEERELLRSTAKENAYYGMNHYSTKFARQLTDPPAADDWTSNIEEGPVNVHGEEIGPVSASPWLRIAPEGFRKLMNWVWKRYDLPVVITENGCPCLGESDVEVAKNDLFRQRYLGLYLDAISRAIYEDGVLVKGYYAWSLLDNFEWSAGYVPRFGIVHTDYETQKRTPKGSALYLKETFVARRKHAD